MSRLLANLAPEDVTTMSMQPANSVAEITLTSVMSESPKYVTSIFYFPDGGQHVISKSNAKEALCIEARKETEEVHAVHVAVSRDNRWVINASLLERISISASSKKLRRTKIRNNHCLHLYLYWQQATIVSESLDLNDSKPMAGPFGSANLIHAVRRSSQEEEVPRGVGRDARQGSCC